jgi:hypothetical protein
MKRVGVLGTFVWDTIRHPGTGSTAPIEQWGGVAYSLAAFSAARPPGWCVAPIVRVGADLAAEAAGFLSDLPGVCRGSRAVITAEANNRVELTYLDADVREERLSGGVSGWDWPGLRAASEGLDALYVNFLSGFELSLEVARALRRDLEIPIYADLHSLFLGPPRSGPREARRLPEWEAWLGCFDAVQLNEAELALLGPPGMDRPDLLRLALRQGPGVVAVTRGRAGACIAAVEGWPADPAAWSPHRGTRRGLATLEEFPAERPLEGDPTGCGDVWGSVFFSALLAGTALPLAVARAHRAAAAKIAVPGMAGLRAHLAEVLGNS